MNKKLNQKQYAKHRGISPQAISKLVKQGKLDGAFIRDGRHYLINPKKADAILAMFENPARKLSTASLVGKNPQGNQSSQQSATPERLTFAEAARREKIARAALLELDLCRQRGKLVERDQVESVAAKIATTVRVGIEAIPAKVAPAIAGMDAPGDVARLLQREFKVILADMAKAIKKLDP